MRGTNCRCELDCVSDGRRQEEFNCHGEVCDNYEDLGNGCGAPATGREVPRVTDRASSSVSFRVRQGRWRYYAVKKGRRVGVFGSWPECEVQVRYYSGAVFKGFNTEEEAISFVKCTV